MGRQAVDPIALEGALRLEGLAHVHGEGFPSAEMKHGPMALISDQAVCISIPDQKEVFGKMIRNVHKVRPRGAKVIVITNDKQAVWEVFWDDVIRVPEDHPVQAGQARAVREQSTSRANLSEQA